MKRPKTTIIETYKCPDCTYKYTVHRPSGKQKESLHRKRIWCIQCKKEKNFTKQQEVGNA